MHLTDLHLSDNTDLEWIEFLVRRVNHECPDVILFSGDFVAGARAYCCPEKVLHALSKMKAQYGKFAIRGNHDVYGAAGQAAVFMRRAGFTILENEYIQLVTNEGLCVLVGGIATAIHKKADVCAVREMRGRPQLRLLMLHEPALARRLLPGTADLIVAGHTHQGQVHMRYLERLWLPKMTGSFVHGMYRVHQMRLYVSAGLGESGPAVRYNAIRELVVFDFE